MNDVYYLHVDVFERKVLQVIRPAALFLWSVNSYFI